MEDTTVPRNNSGFLWCSRRRVLSAALAIVAAAGHAQAQPVLLVGRPNGTVGQYNAVTGALINPNFITESAGNPIYSLTLDRANNHIFTVSPNPAVPGERVGEYDATTGALINPNFITGFGGISQGGVAADGNNHLLVAHGTVLNQYDATTGALLNPNFINTFGLGASGVALDSHNHLFASIFANSISEFDATTGATINQNFINATQPAAIALDGNRLFSINNFRTVGVYDATTGATINANLLTVPNGFSDPTPVLDGNNHLFLAEVNISLNGPVAEYDATTGAIINGTFIPGPVTSALLFMTAVPEPSSLLLVATAGIGVWTRRRRARCDIPSAARNLLDPAQG
jgi:hypothetical protein